MKTPKIVLLLGIFALGIYWATPSNAQEKVKIKKKTTSTEHTSKKAEEKDTKLPDGFVRLASGLEYKIMAHGTGSRHPQLTDHIEMNILLHVEDSVIFDSRKMNNNKPVPLPITAPKFKGDPMEGFMLMVAGDSAVFRLAVDSLKKMGASQPWMKEGQKVEYNVVLLSVRSDADEKKENEEKAAKQSAIDDKILQEYFTKNGIKPMKTASGLYYTIKSEGHGENVKPGQTVNVNYTGMFLDGKKFDSNTDSAFHHMQPFSLEVGKGRVIKGWDEGLQLLKTGTKAILYIPSPLAYGSQDRAPIGPNSILVFDVEILETPDQSKIDDKLIQDYITKNKLNATKTASGLYYVMTQKGLGENAKPGKKVTMNYTGKTLDGKVFDSNTDPAFKHVEPFQFTLGQGMVIKGWDEGVQLFKLGGKGSLIIPSGLAYGAQGAGGAIPPNAVLVFDVEVTGIDK